MHAKELTEAAGAVRLLEFSPDDAIPYLLKANQLLAADDPDEAESWFWRGLERWPCRYMCYSLLSVLRLRRDAGDMLGKHLRCLALWKLALAPEIPDEALAEFGHVFEKTGADPKEPASYEDLAMAFEETLDESPLPAEVSERLRPYRLLNDLQIQAPDDLDAELFKEILTNSERVVPLWRAALREWGGYQDAISPDALAMIVATLGEMAGTEFLDELLELACVGDPRISLHVHWAIWRIGQRFPAEALERFRAAAPGASVALRCALAEQIDLLPETPGRVEALANLLEGFSAVANHRDAAYLLVTVAHGLGESGQDEQARELLAANRRALPKSGLKALHQFIQTKDGFVPALISMGIDEMDIEDVCLDRALLADEEDDLEDEEEKEEAGAPPRFKPGRNDPCWCGSGKKYKKCHLAADEEAMRQPEEAEAEADAAVGDPRTFTALDDLLAFADERLGRRGFAEADRLYFGRSSRTISEDEHAESGFIDWFVHDFRPRGEGPTLIQDYLRKHGPSLPAEQRQLLERWRKARYGLYEVERVEEGTGVQLKDQFGGESFFVHDVSSSNALVQWDAILNRVEEFEGRRLFVGNGLIVPREMLSEVVSTIERDSRQVGQTPIEYVRTNSHRWYRLLNELGQRNARDLKVVTAEGDDMEFCSATYAIRDEQAVVEALAKARVFEDTTGKNVPSGVRHFAWLEVSQSDARRSYGHIALVGGRLRLECNSRQRLELGRQLVEKHAGLWLEHQGDTFESVAAAMERRQREEPASKESETGIPPEVARKLVLKMKADHYGKWPDQPLPALDGKTPLEAVCSAAGRKAVEDLLRLMENHEERASKQGAAAFDFTSVRRTLGLETRA